MAEALNRYIEANGTAMDYAALSGTDERIYTGTVVKNISESGKRKLLLLMFCVWLFFRTARFLRPSYIRWTGSKKSRMKKISSVFCIVNGICRML